MMTPITLLITLLGIFGYAMLGPLAKKVGYSIPPFSFIAVSALILCIVSFIIAIIFERTQVAATYQSIKWGWLIAYSMMNLVAYVFYIIAVNRIPVAEYEMFSILMPIFGGIAAVYLLNEPFHPRYLVALVIMGIGLYVAIGPQLSGKE